MSVLRAVRKRKKVRTLGRVEIMRREDYADLELDAKVELIRSLVPLGLMHVEELLDEEVMALARERYARKAAAIGGRPDRDDAGRSSSRTKPGSDGVGALIQRGGRAVAGMLTIATAGGS